MGIPEPKRKSEIVIEPLWLDPARGWEFEVVCDPEFHEIIEKMAGVSSVLSFENGTAWVSIDARYVAHEVYVYVGCELTKMAKEAKLMRQIDEVVEKKQSQTSTE